MLVQLSDLILLTTVIYDVVFVILAILFLTSLPHWPRCSLWIPLLFLGVMDLVVFTVCIVFHLNVFVFGRWTFL